MTLTFDLDLIFIFLDQGPQIKRSLVFSTYGLQDRNAYHLYQMHKGK